MTHTKRLDGPPLFAPRSMLWVEDEADPGEYLLVDLEAVESPETYVNPRKGDPDYPDPDFGDLVCVGPPRKPPAAQTGIG